MALQLRDQRVKIGEGLSAGACAQPKWVAAGHIPKDGADMLRPVAVLLGSGS